MAETTTELDTTAPFTTRAGLASGLTRRELSGESFRTLFRGMHVAASVPMTPRLRVRAALAFFPEDAWASHDSAGRVYDVPLELSAEEHVSVGHQARRRHRADIVTHVGDESRVHTWRGVRVSTPGQLFVELAGSLGLVDLVVLGDHLVRRGRTTLAALRDFCARSRHKRAGAARRAVAFVRDQVDSPMESRLRMLLVLAGLPEPRVNHTLRREDGTVWRRFDLSYPEVRVLIEYDGRHHIQREDQWERDLARREQNDADGWRTLVVVGADIYRHPEATLERVVEVLRERGLRGVPTRLDDRWRAHFPGQRRQP